MFNKMMSLKNISSKIITNEAKKNWFKVEIISEEHDIFYLEKEWKKVLFKNIDCWLNNSLSVKFARQKKLTYIMLENHNIKVPKSLYINKKTKEIEKLIKENKLVFPLVVKPSIWEHWNWVSVNIKNKEQLKNAIIKAFKYNNEIIIQEFFKWSDYRVFCVNNKVLAVMKRIPAYILWDWKKTIKELIKIENKREERW